MVKYRCFSNADIVSILFVKIAIECRKSFLTSTNFRLLISVLRFRGKLVGFKCSLTKFSTLKLVTSSSLLRFPVAVPPRCVRWELILLNNLYIQTLLHKISSSACLTFSVSILSLRP